MKFGGQKLKRKKRGPRGPYKKRKEQTQTPQNKSKGGGGGQLTTLGSEVGHVRCHGCGQAVSNRTTSLRFHVNGQCVMFLFVLK
jgi:hypothetical protein